MLPFARFGDVGGGLSVGEAGVNDPTARVECKLLRASRNGVCVIFIHGILSSEKAWLNTKTGAFWPNLLLDEPQFADCGVYLFNYRADAFSGTFSLNDATEKLADRISGDLSAERGLVFVGHSMGGIIARNYIVSNQIDLHKRNIKLGVCLVASPSAGSFYANIV